MTASPTPFFAESAVVSHETAAHETQPVLRSTDETQAPAAMPSEEEIEAEIRPMSYEGADLAECVARILALFAPILAEKEREIERACAYHANATIGWERERGRSEELEARALAAEAALAKAVEALEPFARADRALGDELGADGTFRLETDKGYREIPREAFRRARTAYAAQIAALGAAMEAS